MNPLRNAVKSLLPSRLREALRPRHRAFVLRRAMTRLMKDPAACADPANPIVDDLVYGWGSNLSAQDEYLRACIDLALNTRGPILECGSGLSTLVIGAIAAKRGEGHWSLEHKPEWAAIVQGHLTSFGLDRVVLAGKALKDYGDFSWFDPALESMPEQFALVICDGPPAATKGGRYGLVPVMRGRLRPGSIILLDDAGREHERAIAGRWQTELGATLETLGSKKPYIKLTVNA